jgi:hypothetical protein
MRQELAIERVIFDPDTGVYEIEVMSVGGIREVIEIIPRPKGGSEAWISKPTRATILRDRGYAPGDYILSNCQSCGRRHTADKWSRQCLKCATKAAELAGEL